MTKKKTRFKSKLKALARDFIIAGSCLGVCAVSLWLFWNDLNLTSTRTDKDAIATITFKYKVAQRKFTDRVVWERLQQNSPLYNEDTIRTADMASATITFKGGEILDIHENSMVQIFQGSDGGVRLSVGGGGIEVDTSSSKSSAALAVQMENGSTVQLEKGSRLAALTDASGESSFQLRAGSGSVTGGNITGSGAVLAGAAPVSLTAGETVKVETSGEIKKVPLSVTSIPNDLFVLKLEEKETPVHLEWKGDNSLSDKKIIVQTSKNRNFENIEQTFTIFNENSVDIPSSAGALYWRIYEEGSEAENSPAASGRILTENIHKPVLTSPLNDSSIKYRAVIPQISFTWNGNDYADYYRLEIADAPDFYQPKIVVDVRSTNYSVNTLEEGTYFWRVTPFYSVQNTGFSEATAPGRFTVARASALSAPAGVSPSSNANLFYVKNALSTTFRWKSEPSPEGYQLFVSDSESFENVIFQTETKENRIQCDFSPEKLPVGTYYWKVKRNPVPAEDIEESWSEPRAFNVAYYVPQQNRLVFPPENFSVEAEKIRNTSFVWKLSDELNQRIVRENYKVESILQIAKDSDFYYPVYEKQTDLTELTDISLESGNYYWRVGVTDSFTNEINYTQVFRFSVLKQLTPAVIEQPASGSVNMISQVRPLKIRWQPVEGADYYSVRIFDKTKNIKIAENPCVKNNETSFQLENIADKADSFECFVQPVVEATEFSGIRRGETSSVVFNMRNPDSVKLVSPVMNVKLDGLKAFREPVVLTWKDGIDVPEKSQFILQKLQANGNFKTAFVIENPAKNISMADLSEGTYRWIIIASLADGTVVNADAYQSFVVTPIPELNQPQLVEPSAKFIMDAKFLRKNRILRFRWNTVDNATDYTFSLYKKMADGKRQHIVTEKTGKNTSFRFKELKMLDVGEFEWQVTAYSIDKNGREEQHSKAAVSSFDIKIGLPGVIKTKDPGEIFVE